MSSIEKRFREVESRIDPSKTKISIVYQDHITKKFHYGALDGPVITDAEIDQLGGVVMMVVRGS